jgi:cell division protein DivIC
MRIIWTQPPQWVQNTYLLLGLSFLLWMFFFDAEDLVTQYRLRNKFSNLEAEKAYYLEQIEKIQRDKKGLESDEGLLEKFAREKYFMKKRTEDLYVIVDE